MKEFREALPLLFTFGAVLVVSVLFFSFSKADAALLTDDFSADQETATGQLAAQLAKPASEEVINSGFPELEKNIDTTSFLDETPNISTLKIYEDVYFVASETIDVTGHFKSDVIVIGNNVTINGIVDGDLMAVGANVTINAPVDGDLRVGGNNVIINEDINRSLTVAAGKVTLKKGAVISRDAIIQAGDLTLNGVINGKLSGSIGNATINGTIGNDVYFQSVNNLIINETAKISGDVLYSSANHATIDPAAHINGTESYSPPLVEPKEQKSRFTVWFFLRKIISLLGYIMLGVVVLVVLKEKSLAVKKLMLSKAGICFAWGFGYVVIVPLIIAMLLFSLIGIPLSILGVLIFGTTVFLAKIYVGLAIGKIILPKQKNIYLSMVVGITIFYLITTILGSIPFPYNFIGTFVNALGIIWATGAIVLFLKSKYGSSK
ncbi:MAG: hypothetical protein Q8P90_03335 [bacterium]|nr:hypothetical protein [bacterium]